MHGRSLYSDFPNILTELINSGLHFTDDKIVTKKSHPGVGSRAGIPSHRAPGLPFLTGIVSLGGRCDCMRTRGVLTRGALTRACACGSQNPTASVFRSFSVLSLETGPLTEAGAPCWAKLADQHDPRLYLSFPKAPPEQGLQVHAATPSYSMDPRDVKAGSHNSPSGLSSQPCFALFFSGRLAL